MTHTDKYDKKLFSLWEDAEANMHKIFNGDHPTRAHDHDYRGQESQPEKDIE